MLNTSKINNYIFDLDGTLIDSDSVYEQGWFKAFEEKRIEVNEDFIESLVGLSVKDSTDLIAKFVNSMPLALELRAIRENFFLDTLESNEVNLMPYSKNLLEFLKLNDKQLGLATSTFSDKGNQILQKLDIDKFFTKKFFGNQVINSKPDPEIYTTIKQKMNASISDTLVIEDSITGATAALKAGFYVLLVPYRPTNIPPCLKNNSKIREFQNLNDVLIFLNQN